MLSILYEENILLQEIDQFYTWNEFSAIGLQTRKATFQNQQGEFLSYCPL